MTKQVLPSKQALENPVANLIRNAYRPEVDKIFSLARGTRDKQYKVLLYDRAREKWREGIYQSNQYAEKVINP